MCGRYSLRHPIARIVDAFSPVLSEIEDLYLPRFNIAPTQEVPVVRLNKDGDRVLRMVRWGLVPSWAKDPAIGNKMINARAETAADKPAFRSAMSKRRCLIPADGFFEWQKLGPRKQPMYARLRDDGVFAFAGLWERWFGDRENPLDTFTILTTTPSPLMAPIHDRMPVIIPPDAYSRWLDRTLPASDVLDLLTPYPAERMEAFPVSTEVNSPRNDTCSCIAPLAKS